MSGAFTFMRTGMTFIAISVLAVIAIFATTASAQSEDASVATVDLAQGSLVEDYQHPNKEGAAAIGMTLKHGNGKIYWVNCTAGADLVTVESDSINTTDHIACFKVTGVDGFLSLEIPSTYFIKAGSHKLAATLTAQVNGQEVKRDYSIKPGQLAPVGETVYPDEGQAALVELRSVS